MLKYIKNSIRTIRTISTLELCLDPLAVAVYKMWLG